MSHVQFEELVSLFIDRELDAKSEQELFAHLGSCEECRGFLKASMMLQGDIKSTKPGIPASMGDARRGFAPDHRAVHGSRLQTTTRQPVTTFVLLMLITLVVGFLFSARVEVRRTSGFDHDEMTQQRTQIERSENNR
jgi:anti-sigma factor RsiW